MGLQIVLCMHVLVKATFKRVNLIVRACESVTITVSRRLQGGAVWREKVRVSLHCSRLENIAGRWCAKMPIFTR